MAEREKASIPDVLADRYASAAMCEIWSPAGKVRLEREYWLAVLQAQRDLGVDVPQAVIDAYTRVADRVDLASIRRRERVARHDVKARIDEFCALAGYEHIHKGLTSRDVTENVEQLQVVRSLRLVRMKYAAALHRLAARAEEFRTLVVTGRTHNVAAQPTTLGKRLAMFGEEMIGAFRHLDALVGRYPMRGIKGAVGTQLDQLTLLGSPERVRALEERVLAFLGVPRVLGAVGQVYPRSLDYEVIAALYLLGSGPGSLAKTVRLMTGFELVSEGFAEGQVGSSAMPHKMNARSCERINGLQTVLNGYLNMAMGLAGDQWGEGDVSCSVVRRVALPGAMFAIDGMLDTLLTVVRELRAYPHMLARERQRFVPFLSSTTILMAAVQRGAGREAAHEAIREHTVAAADGMREGRDAGPELLDRLARDPRLGLTRGDLERLCADDGELCGAAVSQADAFVAAAREIAGAVPGAVDYEPPVIL